MNFSKFQKNDQLNLLKIRSLFLCIVLLKGWERLISPGIWAEDGTIFLKQAFEYGWSSLFLPYDGYFHTFPRIIAIICTWIPVKLIPIFIVIVCYYVFVYVITFFFSLPYKWLFRSKPLTFVAASLLLLAPGQIEMLGNLTNLHWYFLLLLSVLALKNIEKTYTISEIFIAFLCISTSGACVILFPVFSTRIFLKRKEGKATNYGEYFILFSILLISLIHLTFSPSTALIYFPLTIYFKIYVRHFFYFFIFHVFLGDFITMHIHYFKSIHYITTLIISSFIYIHLRKNWERSNILIIVLCLCALFLPVMVSMARPLSMFTILSFSHYDMYHWFSSRYSFYVPAISAIFWVFIISRIEARKWLRYLTTTIILCSQIFFNSHRVVINKYTTPTDWSSKAEILEKSIRTGCPDKVKVNIAPSGWYVEFITHKPNNCDK